MYHPSTSFRLRRSQSCRSSVWQQPAKIRSQIPNHGIITVPSVVSIGAWDIEGLDPVSPHQTWIETVGMWTWLQSVRMMRIDWLHLLYSLYSTVHIKSFIQDSFISNVQVDHLKTSSLKSSMGDLKALTRSWRRFFCIRHSLSIVTRPSPPTDDTSLGGNRSIGW